MLYSDLYSKLQRGNASYFKTIVAVLISGLLLTACTNNQAADASASTPVSLDSLPDSSQLAPPPIPKGPLLSAAEIDSIYQLHDSTWVDIEWLDSSILIDLRYATTNNFMELQIYDCPKCYMRLVVAKALIKAQKALKPQGLGFKMFDCFRPRSAQNKLWKKTPDPRYVSPPSRGSMHSRGIALDLTLVDLATREQLEMGTHYDYFGRKAYWAYKEHPQEILDNRQLLLSTLKEHGFKTVTTEWWHFSYRRAWFALSDMNWECEETATSNQ